MVFHNGRKTDNTCHVLLNRLFRKEFDQLLDQSPGLARKLLVSTIKRVHELEPSLLG